LEDNKKPGGGRDISDLKARLGLKKTGVMPAVSPQQGGQQAPAPTGTAQASQPSQPSAIPSPFGPPPGSEPAPAAPPDPRRDPFAQQQAANLAAFYGIGQVLPGSGDSVSAAPISKPKPWGRIIAVLGVGAVTFFLGNACGRVYQSRVEFNNTIDHAADIRKEVDGLAKKLNEVNDALNGSAPTRQGQPDFELSKKLGAMDLKKPDTTKLFHTNYYHFEPAAIERLFTYFDNTIKLYDAIAIHAKRTEGDQQSIENYIKSQHDNTGAGKNYGVIQDWSSTIPVAKLVEMGAPVCPGGKPDCKANELEGFKFRTEAGQAWTQRPLKGKPGEIVLPINKTPLFNQAMNGNPDMLAMRDYLRRLGEIRELAGKLSTGQKDLTGDLEKETKRVKVFTF
jgi:hypothetical protein